MELTKCKLGELITQRREKSDGTPLPICGVSKEGLIPPKQIDADTSIYNVFYRDDFIFNPARMELNSIAINDKYDRAICSSLYEVFYVHRKDLLLPHYLKLIVKQKWFTRYCEFLGQSSAREYCRFNNISEIEIEFPSIEEQEKIVEQYTILQNRIAIKKQINDNLEAQLRAYFAHFISDDEFSHLGKLKDVCSMQYGYTETATLDNVGPKFLRITDIAQSYIDWNTVPYCKISDQDYNKYVLREGDVVVARTGATVGASKMMYGRIPDSVFASFLVRIKPLDEEYKYYFGLAITSSDFLDFVQTNAGGSAQPQANPPLLGEYELPIPSKGRLKDFNSVVLNFLATMETNEIEISKLKDLQKTLLYTMSRR